MTKEELKDEICEYVHNLHKVEPFNGFSYRDLRDVAEHFALPREKRIAELEQQIEKMKNCRNCKNEKIEGACGHFTQVGWCKNWELSE